VAVRYK